jgi:hypothetical protein
MRLATRTANWPRDRASAPPAAGSRLAVLLSSEPFALTAFFLAGLAVCWIARPLSLPLLSDNQHYYFIAERAAAGVPPHVSHFDPKHALSMLLSAGAMLLGRRLGVDDVLAARALSILITAASMALTWLVARRLTGSVIAAYLAGLAMLGFSRFVLMGAMGARPKVFMVFFMLLALLWVGERRPLLAGLAGAAAFLCWQPAAILLGFAPPVLLLERSCGRRLARYALGAAVPIAAYQAYFVVTGAIGEQLSQAYGFPSSYLGSFPPPLHGVALHATWILGIKNGITAETLVPAAALAADVVLLAVAAVRPRRLWAALVAEPGRLYFLLCAHAALFFDLWNYQGFPDRFLLEPFMAVGAGALGAWLARSFARTGAVAELVAATVAFAFVALPIARAEYRLDVPFDLADQEALAARVDGMLDEGLSVWAVGCTHLLALAHTNNFVPYGFFFRGVEHYAIAHTGQNPYLPTRSGVLPDVILWSRSKLRGADLWLPVEYRRVDEPGFRAQGIRIWRRRPERLASQFTLDSRAREASARPEE